MLIYFFVINRNNNNNNNNGGKKRDLGEFEGLAGSLSRLVTVTAPNVIARAPVDQDLVEQMQRAVHERIHYPLLNE